MNIGEIFIRETFILSLADLPEKEEKGLAENLSESRGSAVFRLKETSSRNRIQEGFIWFAILQTPFGALAYQPHSIAQLQPVLLGRL
jgi:hypothetical protein